MKLMDRTFQIDAGLTTLVPFGNHALEGDETLVQAVRRIQEEVEAAALVDFGFHFILQNRPSILNSLPQAMELGVKSFKMFMTYKKRPGRMCDDDYICNAMELVAKGGGVLQLHCESGNIIEVSYWAILREFNPSWFFANLALVIWPLFFIQRLMTDIEVKARTSQPA